MTMNTERLARALRAVQAQVNHLLADLTLTEFDEQGVPRYRPVDNLLYSNMNGALARWHTEVLKLFDALEAEKAALSQHAAEQQKTPAIGLDIFKEASDWSRATGKPIPPDAADMLGWITGAVQAFFDAPKQAEQQAEPVDTRPCSDPDACDAARGCKLGCGYRSAAEQRLAASEALAHREGTHARLYRFLRDSTPLAMLQFIAVHSDTPEEFDAALTAYMQQHERAARRLNPAQHPGAPEVPQGELF